MAATRSLSLAAYRAVSRRGPPPAETTRPMRPAGEVAWIHLGNLEDMRALLDLAERLRQLRGELTILLTRSDEDAEPWPLSSTADHVILADAPDEHPDCVSAFLEHWQPDVGLWVWGGLRPNLVDLAAQKGVPLHLVSADKAGFEGRPQLWLPDLARHLAGCFTSASARSAAAAQRLARFGFAPKIITVMPPLRPAGRVLPCAISDIDEMSAHLSGRPVWLAANVNTAEWQSVSDAHRIALGSAHRLLLVLHPADATDNLADLHAQLDADGLSHETWSDGEPPRETTQVLIADLPDELGLWYRLASVSFLGGSMATGLGGGDPMDAASLGTAILYGPHVGKYVDSYSRLANAGAARIINDSNSLGNAVARLISPEQAAAMAHAGWDVATEGAEVVDEVIDHVQDSLDARLFPTAPREDAGS